MEIKRCDEQGHVVLEVTGRLDASTTQEFEKSSADSITQDSCRMVLDLSGLEYISSAGLRNLLVLARKLRSGGGTLTLCNLSGIVEEVVNISGVQKIIPVFDNLENAIHSKS